MIRDSEVLLVGQHEQANLDQKVCGQRAFFLGLSKDLLELEKAFEPSDTFSEILAFESLQKLCPTQVEWAPLYAEIYDEIWLGSRSPSQLQEKLAATNWVRLKQIVDVLTCMENASSGIKKVSYAQLLFQGKEKLATSQKIPAILDAVGSIHLRHTLPMTEVELAILGVLAELGMSIKLSLALDKNGRGLSAPVNALADRCEALFENTNLELVFEDINAAGPTKEFLEKFFEPHASAASNGSVFFKTFGNTFSESERVAGAIARLAQQYPKKSIGIAYRDETKVIQGILDALKREGVSVFARDRSLEHVGLTTLLLLPFLAQSKGLSKESALYFFFHPQSKHCITSETERSGFSQMLFHAFEKEITAAKLSFAKAQLRNCQSLDVLGHLLTPIGQIKRRASVGAYAKQALSFLKEQILEDKNHAEWTLRKELKQMLENLKGLEGSIPLEAFVSYVRKKSQEIASATQASMTGKICALPYSELAHRDFDYLFFPDLTSEHAPKIVSAHPLVNDSDRRAINKLLAHPVFCIFEEDPLEVSSVAPKQAYEPFWFMRAMGSAKEAIYFSHALADEKGKEQGPSIFYLEAHSKVLDPTPGELDMPATISRDSEEDFVLSKFAQDSVCLESLANKPRFEPGQFGELFAKKFGKTPAKPLTPTTIEAFARCHFKGYVEKLLKVPHEPQVPDALDARLLGRIAHLALERFFRDNATPLPSTVTPAMRSQFEGCFRSATETFQSHLGFYDAGLIHAHLAWLEHSLLRLLSELCKHPLLDVAKPKFFEKGIGFKSALKMDLLGHEVYLGGIIDRVDAGKDVLVVIDYKLSQTRINNDKLSTKSLYETHFQMPLYLHLAQVGLQKENDTQLFGYFASIRDGTVSKTLGEGYSEESLKAGLEKVMAPLFEGRAPLNIGDHCKSCGVVDICRNAGALKL